jgi:hypothetical protein
MVMIPVYMGESRTELTTVRSTYQVSRTIRSELEPAASKKRLLNSPPSRARCARTSCIGGISRRGTITDVWRVCLGLVVVISNNLYAEAWGALGRIE